MRNKIVTVRWTVTASSSKTGRYNYFCAVKMQTNRAFCAKKLWVQRRNRIEGVSERREQSEALFRTVGMDETDG